jgi:hypothetical protein
MHAASVRVSAGEGEATNADICWHAAAGPQPAWGQLGALCGGLWAGLAPPARKLYLPWWSLAYACLCLYLFAYMSGSGLCTFLLPRKASCSSLLSAHACLLLPSFEEMWRSCPQKG